MPLKFDMIWSRIGQVIRLINKAIFQKYLVYLSINSATQKKWQIVNF